MMQSTATKAFTLRSQNVGEYDRSYLLLTEAWGKVWVRANQIRRTKKLLAGHLQPLLMAQVLLRERGNTIYLQEAVGQAHYSQVGLQQVARLQIVAEMADRFIPLHQPEPAVFWVLQYASTLLTQDAWDPLTFIEVVAKMTVAVGIAPELSRCVVSQEALAETGSLYWSSQHGGVVVQTDHILVTNDQTLRPLSTTACKLLRVLMEDQLVAGRVKVSAEVVAEVESVLLQYVQVQLQRVLPELPFLVLQ